MFNFFKIKNPITQEIKDYYLKNLDVINKDSDRVVDYYKDDYLTGEKSTRKSRKFITELINKELERINKLKTRFPHLSHYIREEYSSCFDHAWEVCSNKDGDYIENREMALRLATFGVAKYIPNTHKSDMEFLLVLILNNENLFYRSQSYFEDLAYSLDFIPEDYWHGNYCSEDKDTIIELNNLINQIHEIVLFEKPIREIYDNFDIKSKLSKEVYEILNNAEKSKVFMRYFNHDNMSLKLLKFKQMEFLKNKLVNQIPKSIKTNKTTKI